MGSDKGETWIKREPKDGCGSNWLEHDGRHCSTSQVKTFCKVRFTAH